MQTSLKFGTSGLRGLAVDLAGSEARRYVSAFLRVLQQRGVEIPALYIGSDFRESSPEIARDCAAAAAEMGVPAISCGTVPTPALALHAIAAGAPGIMVTGSHIPQDRNGLKFYTRDGEIEKADEAAIADALLPATPGNYDIPARDESRQAAQFYVARYADLLPPMALRGMRIGVYEHSSVARDLLPNILGFYGAEIVRLGRVDGFVAVDTEAFSDDVFRPLPDWLAQHRLDAIISADGDADRPLLLDDKGRFVRGDVLGLLAARFIAADAVVTPVTSNKAIEETGFFAEVRRTRVGSPYVIEGMIEALRQGRSRVIGFEANGGTLLGSDLPAPRAMARLMTRDAVFPLLSAFGLAAQSRTSISDLVDALPLRASVSGRLENVAAAKSAAFLDILRSEAGAAAFFQPHKIERFAEIDGLQFWLDNGAMVHFRPSGNAPEMRCYVEVLDPAIAERILSWALAAAADRIA